MDKETIFRVLFKCKVDGEQKFTDFSQLTPAGRRVIILVINLALGGKPKDTLKWLKDRNIISESQYDERSVYDVIRHWKMTSGEVFLKHHKLEKDTLLKNDEESKQIRSFFERNGNTVTEMKWDAPTFD